MITPEQKQFIQDNPEMLKGIHKAYITQGHNFDHFIDTHAKKPILTTEDGVDLFNESDIVYSLNCHDWFVSDEKAGIYLPGSVSNNRFKYFSSPESRTAYILQNKPLVPLKEQVEVLKESKQFTASQMAFIKGCLTELAKCKTT